MQTSLISTEHGFHDFDIEGAGSIERATVDQKIRSGDLFNIYLADGVKHGVKWIGTRGVNNQDLEVSIKKFEAKKAGTKNL